MKHLKEYHNVLLNDGYFEDNVNMFIRLSNKEHERLFDRFIMSDGNYKKFSRAYIAIQDVVKVDNSVRISLTELFKKLLDQTKGCDAKLRNTSFCALSILIFSLLYSDGKLDNGSACIKLRDKALFDILFDQNKSLANTNRDIIKYIGTKKFRDINCLDATSLSCFVLPYMFGIIYPEILVDDNYMDVLNKVNVISLDTMDDMANNSAEHRLLKANSCGISIFSTSFCNDFDKVLSYKPIQRKGFLQEQYRDGIYTESLERTSITLKFHVKELVNNNGLVVCYIIWNKDFRIIGFEDYTTNTLFVNQFFSDYKRNANPDEHITLTATLFFTMCRDAYISEVNNEAYITSKIPVSRFNHYSNTKHNFDGVYEYKEIWIAPYTRKLQSGDWADAEKISEAKKFGFTLEKGQTFVNSFQRRQRYLSDK